MSERMRYLTTTFLSLDLDTVLTVFSRQVYTITRMDFVSFKFLIAVCAFDVVKCRSIKLVTVLPDLPLACAIRTVGSALDYAVAQAAIRYRGYLNVSLTKEIYYEGNSCYDYDSAVMGPIAKELWRNTINRTDECVAVIEMGNKIENVKITN